MLVGVMEKTPENPEESSQRNSLLYYIFNNFTCGKHKITNWSDQDFSRVLTKHIIGWHHVHYMRLCLVRSFVFGSSNNVLMTEKLFFIIVYTAHSPTSYCAEAKIRVWETVLSFSLYISFFKLYLLQFWILKTAPSLISTINNT